jgi:hypothetical protein
MFVEICYRGDVKRVQFQQFKSAMMLAAEMLEQVRLMDAREQVRPDRVLLLGKNDLLIFSCIFLIGIYVFCRNVPRVGWSLISIHSSPFYIEGIWYENSNHLRREYITAKLGRQGMTGMD